MKKITYTLFSLVLLSVFSQIAYTAINSNGGQTGRTQKTPGTAGCTCHGASATTGLSTSITGPSSSLTAEGAAGTFTMTMGSGGAGVKGGFNIAVDDDNKGFLVATDANTAVSSSNKELYHTSSKSYSSGTVSWGFKFVPTTVSSTSVTLYGTGISSDGSGTSGDFWNYTSNTFNVTASFPSTTTFVPSTNTWDLKDNFPLNQSNTYDRFASIYTSSDVPYGRISRLGYFIGEESNISGQFMVYMKKVSNSTFSAASTTDTEISGATLVYSGSLLSSYTYGWVMFELNTGFDFNSDNLEIIIFNNRGGTAITDNKKVLANFVSGASQYWSNTSNGSANGVVYGIRPNIRVQGITATTGLTLGTVSNSTVGLSWTANTTGAGYRIVFKPGSSAPASTTDGGYKDISSSSTTSYTVTGLPAGRQYSFVVYTKSQGGAFSASASSAVTATTTAYSSGTFVNEQSATYIMGQSSCEAEGVVNEGGISAATLNAPNGVFVEAGSTAGTEGKVVIADSYNHRVLIFNSAPTGDKPTANVVVGQSSTTGNSSGTTSSTLKVPEAAIIYGTKLIVADRDNHRVLIWNTVPTSTGTNPADIVLGQANFTSGSANRGGSCAANTLSSPEAVAVYNNKLLVADADNNRVLVWNDITALSSGANADVVIGQSSFTANAAPGSNNSSLATLYYPKSLALTTDGKLVIASRLEHRVLIYNAIPTSNGANASLVLGQSSNTANSFSFTTSSTSMGFIRGVAVSPINNKLAVSELGNGRVMIWNAFPSTSNQAADYVLGRPSLTATSSSTFSNESAGMHNASDISSMEMMHWSAAGNLYVCVAGRNAVLRFDAGDQAFTGPSTLSTGTISNNSVQLSWSGGTATSYRIVAAVGYTAPGSASSPASTDLIFDNLTGSSTTITGLACNTTYSFSIWGKKSSPSVQYTSSPDPAPSVTATISAGTGCANMPTPNGSVKDVCVYGSIAYMAGEFTSIGGLSRNGLAAVDLSTGQITSWNPNLNNGTDPKAGYCIKVNASGSHVFVGGNFSKVGSTNAEGLAKISTSTGAATTFPTVSGQVEKMCIAPNDNIYFYGTFSDLGANSAIDEVGGVDASGNVITAFDPDCSNASALRAIAATNSYVYLGHGNATLTYNGANSRKGMAELDASNGTATSFNPAPDNGAGVFDIVVNDYALYICGSFEQINNYPTNASNTARRKLAKFVGGPGSWALDNSFAPTNSGNGPNTWTNTGAGTPEIRALLQNGSRLYIYGTISNYGGTPRYRLMAIDTGTAALQTTFDIGVNDLDGSFGSRLAISTAQNKLVGITSSGTHIAGRPVRKYFIVSTGTGTVSGTNTKLINGNGTYDFSSPATGVDIDFSGYSNSTDGYVTVEYISDAPTNVSGISESNVSNYRWIVDKPDRNNFYPNFTSAELRFDLDEIPNRGNIGSGHETDMKIYKRSTPGMGAFTDCGTVTYDNTTHELKVTVSDFSEFVFASNSSNNPLPVTLLAFDVKAMGVYNQLSWSTAQEKNSNRFVVERSLDAKHWSEAGERSAAGNSSSPRSYTFSDPFTDHVLCYYRLRMEDKNGEISYSDLRALDRRQVTNGDAEIKLYPNPSQGSLHLQLSAGSGQQVQLRITDVSGKLQYEESLFVQAEAEHDLNLEQFKNGVYFIEIQGATFSSRSKLLISR